MSSEAETEQPKSSRKGIIIFIRNAGISGLLLWWLFQGIDVKSIVELAVNGDHRYLIGGCGLFFFLNLLMLWRWWMFVDALELKTDFFSVVRYHFFGTFGNLFLPSAIGGDVIKAYGITRGMDKKAGALASILLDRLSGFGGIAIVGIVAFIFGGPLVQDSSVLMAISFMGFGSLAIVLVLFNEPIYEFCCRIFGKLPKLQSALMNIHYDIALMKNKQKEGYGAILLSLFTQSMLAVMFWMIAQGLGANVSLVYFLIFSPIICIVSTLPSIGGLGVREIGWVYLLAKVGVPENISAGMSLISFSYMIVVGLIGGIFYVSTLSSRRVQHHSQNASASR